MAVADAAGVEVRRHLWSGDRAANKVSSAAAVLELLLERVGAAASAGSRRGDRAPRRIGAGLAPARDPRPIRPRGADPHPGHRRRRSERRGASSPAAAGAVVTGCDPAVPRRTRAALDGGRDADGLGARSGPRVEPAPSARTGSR